ncbi:hypothetical protein AAF712_005647 [Marasmius tenuissimus]|uniref:Uncharacterized protein n=1 Tax=Marasmius tenuissimus TaxID=585030 RepID=A0ABR3A1B5_9AGAR
MDGTVLRGKVAAFRVLPHVSRYKPIDLPENIQELIDISKERLDELIEEGEDGSRDGTDYAFPNLPSLRGNFETYEDDEVPDVASEAEGEEEPASEEPRKSKRTIRPTEKVVAQANLWISSDRGMDIQRQRHG